MKQIALAIILFWTCSLIYKILIGFDSSVMEVDEILVVPNLTYWFGKDDFGRDIYLRLIDGFINSFQIILFVTLITSFSGILIGVLSGYLGGRLDQVIKFVTTLFMSFPGILSCDCICSHTFSRKIKFNHCSLHRGLGGVCKVSKGANFTR